MHTALIIAVGVAGTVAVIVLLVAVFGWLLPYLGGR